MMMENKKKNLPAHYNGGKSGTQNSNLTFSYPFPATPPYLQLTTPPQFPWPVCKMVWVKFASHQPHARTPHIPHRAVPAGLSGAASGARPRR